MKIVNVEQSREIERKTESETGTYSREIARDTQIERCTVNFWFKFLKQSVTIDSRQQLVIAIASTANERRRRE